jgi:hypothetical protein
MRGLLPPFAGTDPTTLARSPFLATMGELVAQLGGTPERRQLLRNLIAYRALLSGDGYNTGLQFIDGSFVEDIERSENRAPRDIDVFSLVDIPPKYLADRTLWSASGLQFWNTEIADRNKNKSRFALDTYALLFQELPAIGLISGVIYWYSLFSHQRTTLAWKGFVALLLDPQGDQAALITLGSS